MVRLQLPSLAARIFATSAVLTITFGVGVAVGHYFFPERIAASDDHSEQGSDRHVDADLPHTDREDAQQHALEENHLALSRPAFENLQLDMGYAPRGDYWRSIVTPAQVVGIPGRSGLTISAPVSGIVERVDVREGESLLSGQPLFAIRLTDESLAAAQSLLVQTLTRQQVVENEAARLAPLTQSKTVSGSKSRELEYELHELKAKQATLRQELIGRGLPEELIDAVVAERRLVTHLTVYPPQTIGASPGPLTEAPGTAAVESSYSVQKVYVEPGATVVRGQQLCSADYHAELLIEGVAFQEDLPVLERIQTQAWPLVAESSEATQSDLRADLPDGLRLLRVDNRVDETTQTVRFYALLPNEATASRQQEGRVFQQWRFRPGQRLHLRLPVEKWSQQITLPAEAVAIDGFNAYVFAEHLEGEVEVDDRLAAGRVETAGLTTSSGASTRRVSRADLARELDPGVDAHVYIELEPVPVVVLHRDDQTVVIADDGQLAGDVRIALNNALKLHLAMKLQGAGGDDHHHHDH